MADVFDKATRSRVMRAIRSTDTKPELALAAALDRLDVPYHRGAQSGLPGRPDFVLPRVKLAVFVHGCYWHLCPRHYRAPKAGEAWLRKMDANRRRDVRVRRRLRRLGWSTMVVWEHEAPASGAARVRNRASRLAA